MDVRRGALKAGRPGCTLVIFFRFLCSALLTLVWFSAGDFQALPEGKGLLLCLGLILLVTAAYAGSCYGGLYLPVSSALMGALCAAALSLVACGLAGRDMSRLYLLPALALAVPLQFAISVSGMETALLLRRALSLSCQPAEERFAAQNIAMLASLAASACLVAGIVFR